MILRETGLKPKANGFWLKVDTSGMTRSIPIEKILMIV